MAGYWISLTPDDGSLLVECPALPEVTSFGENHDDAIAHGVDAIEEALAFRIAHGEDIPAFGQADATVVEGVTGYPAFAELPLLTDLKVELYRACREQGIIRAELVRRLDWNRESVDRLFRLDHASRIQQLDAAFRAIGLEVRFEVSNVDHHRAMA